jgi:hypothetical protein
MLTIRGLLFLALALNATMSQIVSKSYVGYKQKNLEMFTPPDELVYGDQFGHAVAVGDDVALVSATKRVVISAGVLSDDGVVYVYRKDSDGTFNHYSTLASSIGNDGFGEALAYCDGTAIVGAWKDQTYGYLAGRVDVYYSTSDETLDTKQTLYASQPAEQDFFGYSVAIIEGSGYYPHGTVIVGAYGHDHDPHVADSGTVFVFSHSSSYSWELVATITPSESANQGYFGWSISAHSDAIAIGAPGQESVFVYHLEGKTAECPHDGKDMPDACSQRRRRLQGGGPEHHFYTMWSYIEILHVVNGYDGYYFGSSVACVNDTFLSIAVGSPMNSDKGVTSGSVTMLTRLNNEDIWSSWDPGNQRQSVDPFDANQLQTSRRLGDVPLDDAAERNSISEKRNRIILASTESTSRKKRRRLPEEDHQNDHRQNIWSVNNYEYATDKDGRYWMLESKSYGDKSGQMYGSAVDMYENNLVVGSLPGPFSAGSFEILVRNQTSYIDTNSPVYKGPLFKTAWQSDTVITSTIESVGDYFGSSISIHDSDIVVGGYLGGASESTMGTGAAYYLSSYKYITGAASNQNMNASQHSIAVVGGSIVFLVLLLAGVVVGLTYGGMKLAKEVPRMLSPSATSEIAGRQLDISLSSVNSSHPLTSNVPNNTYVESNMPQSYPPSNDYKTQPQPTYSHPGVSNQYHSSAPPPQQVRQAPRSNAGLPPPYNNHNIAPMPSIQSRPPIHHGAVVDGQGGVAQQRVMNPPPNVSAANQYQRTFRY